MSKVWIRLPNDERLQLRYSVWTGVLGVYHEKRMPGPTPGEKALEKVMEIVPGGEVMGTSYADILKEADLFAGGAQGKASFQIGKHGIEIESHLHPVRIAGILPVPSSVYQQCEVIGRVDGTQVLQRRFI